MADTNPISTNQFSIKYQAENLASYKNTQMHTHMHWMPPQQQMKDHPAIKLMAALAERDAAIQERNAAFSEKKAALAERDLAILQRDAAIQERNAAAMERDNAMAALEYARENAMNGGSACPPGCPAPRGSKHVHHPIQPHHQMEMPFHARETQTSEPFPISVVEPAAFANAKLRRAKRPRKDTKVITYKKPAKPQRKGRRTASNEDPTNKHVAVGRHDTGGPAEDLNKQLSVTKHEWKGQDLGLNQVMFDDSTMPIPVCSCTGVLQQCYKWGNGGWQSACCTTTMSMYPLPVMANKRHARVGGRKMSGSAFSKLLSRLAAEGHDLSNPLDLKDHWAKHGTNRYITIK